MNPKPIQLIGLEHINLKAESKKIKKRLEKLKSTEHLVSASEGLEELEGVSFAHLHNHTQYSVLQSTTQIANLVNAAAKDEMSAVALTDTANMMAAFHFVQYVNAYNKTNETNLKAIVCFMKL